MWRIIRSLYKEIKSCIILGPEKTRYFDINAGVRQGCVLSPILFSIFINGMAKDIIESGIGIPIRKKLISMLLYADDIVLLTKNQKYLQKGMNIIAKFGKNGDVSTVQKRHK